MGDSSYRRNFDQSKKNVRWPRSAAPNINETSNSNYKHQIQITNIKFKFVTSNLNSSHQIQIHHIKFKFTTSNSNSSHQIQIHHIKFKFITSNSNSSHQMHGQRYIIYFLMNFMIAALTLTSCIMAVFTTTEHELTSIE
jgi:ribosome-associated toxin RatA of RatAB toxin-antitoxin module